MGNGSSGPRMAISAMAEMMKITKPQMMELRNACLRYAKPGRDGESQISSGPIISRTNFHRAMMDVKVDSTDMDILDHLYTMWDKIGDAKSVNLLLFLAGIAPLASTLDVSTKLQFAFEIFDVHRSGRLRIGDALKILGGINATASYFGDAVITPQAIEILVEDIYQGSNDILYMEHLEKFASHPALIQFASAAGTMRYGGAKAVGSEV